MKLLLVIFVLTLLWIKSHAFPSRNDLHSFMDDDELRFYFGSEKDLPEYEIVDLPENLSTGRESVVDEDGSEDDGKYLNFKVFDQQIELNLFPNKHLLSPYAKIVSKSANRTIRRIDEPKIPEFCHYLHSNSFSTASISNCDSKQVHGLVFLPDETLEILPLNARLRFLLEPSDSKKKKNGIGIVKVPHLIKRSIFDVEFEDDFLVSSFRERKIPKFSHAKSRGVDYNQPTVELGLFFDEAFYKHFAPFFDNDKDKLRNFILSYINGVQSLYYHSSLGRKVDFTIVYIEMMEEQPPEMPHAYGERNALLDNFCHYQKSMNPEDDRNVEHWDMAVYVSALDFFAWDANGSKNGVTMG
jgi:hypothetical protein